jgi:hypothetical protein
MAAKRQVLGCFSGGMPIPEAAANRLQRRKHECCRWLRITHDYGAGPFTPATFLRLVADVRAAPNESVATIITTTALAAVGWSQAELAEAGLTA